MCTAISKSEKESHRAMGKYDVIIIGAGPSGIFCAYELIQKKPEWKVLLVEKGRRIENRACPKRTSFLVVKGMLGPFLR